ncbi:MAG: transglutaminase-like domain-containing protein, partial [Tannerellaceae bacterium]|nr:transglutaminase-like domain-containing protein [Tannerellaceae bacterium]
MAGENRPELEKVLAYYSTSEDSLKYRAACFLIENMPYHFARNENYQSPEGEMYRPDISRFSSPEEVGVHCDSLMRKGYRPVSQNQYDISYVKSEFLIRNIELAFEVWQKPWAKEIPFDVFCRYILPYRSQIEPLTGLREELMNRYLPLLDSAGVTTPFETCKVINSQLRKELRYRNTGLSFYPTIEDTYKSGISQCDGLCNLGVHIMRAVGIPVAVYYIPVWTKMDLGHSWCAVWDSGKFHSFGPGELHPDEHRTHYQISNHLKPAKVYRKDFDYNRETEPLEDGFITSLKNPTFRDVTEEYWDKPVTVSIDSHLEFKERQALIYLCAHNRGEWQPLAIGRRDGNACSVADVWGDNIFILADSPDGRGLRYITHPFYMDTLGTVQELIPDFSRKDSFRLANNEHNRKNMILSYWNPDTDQFNRLSDFTEEDTITFYHNVPGNALLRFSGMTAGRVFI